MMVSQPKKGFGILIQSVGEILLFHSRIPQFYKHRNLSDTEVHLMY